MRLYRCTRSAHYQRDCLGRDDTALRQGHYVSACDADHARQAMAAHFPTDATHWSGRRDLRDLFPAECRDLRWAPHSPYCEWCGGAS